MNTEPSRDPLTTQALGRLVMAAGTTEAWLAVVLVRIAHESEMHDGLQRVRMMRVGQILDEFRDRDDELPDGLQALLDELRGPKRLFARRDQIVHATWVSADDGTVYGANLRKSLFRGDGPEPPQFGLDEIESVIAGFDAVSERLGAWFLMWVLDAGTRAAN